MMGKALRLLAFNGKSALHRGSIMVFHSTWEHPISWAFYQPIADLVMFTNLAIKMP